MSDSASSNRNSGNSDSRSKLGTMGFVNDSNFSRAVRVMGLREAQGPNLKLDTKVFDSTSMVQMGRDWDNGNIDLALVLRGIAKKDNENL